MNCSVGGRSRRPFCDHKRGISLDDNLGTRDDHVISSSGVGVANTDDGSEPMGPQEGEECLSDRLGRLLSCEDMADVHFVVGGGREGGRKLRIPAHRLILSVGSPVLREMLSRDDTVEEVEMDFVEVGVFLELLRFLYTDQLRLSKENVIQTLLAAKEFKVPALENACRRYVQKNVSASNCLLIWMKARETSEEKEIEEMSKRVIQRFANTVCLSRDFLRLDRKSVHILLQDDLLRIPEAQLFQAVTRWAKNECLRHGLCPTRINVRQSLAELIPLIRFPLMSSEEIRRLVANEGVLEDETLRALLSSQRTWTRMREKIQFSSVLRAQQIMETTVCLTVQRFHSYDNQLLNTRLSNELLFSCNRRVFVSAIGVYGPKKALNTGLIVRVMITRVCDEDTCPLLDTHVTEEVMKGLDGSQPVITVKLKDCFECLPNTKYRVQTTIQLDENNRRISRRTRDLIDFFYGTEGLMAAKVKTRDGQHVIFSFLEEEEDREEDELVPLSAPSTPNPPPRPPPPRLYRRQSRLDRLRRALSFSGGRGVNDGIVGGAESEEVTRGQIPVILFYC